MATHPLVDQSRGCRLPGGTATTAGSWIAAAGRAGGRREHRLRREVPAGYPAPARIAASAHDRHHVSLQITLDGTRVGAHGECLRRRVDRGLQLSVTAHVDLVA